MSDLETAIVVVQRELELRRRVDPLWVAGGQIKAAVAAADEIGLAAVLQTLQALRAAPAA